MVLTDEEVAYMGDDIVDLAVLAGSGWRRRRPTPYPKCGRACTGSAGRQAAAAPCAS